MSDIKQTFVPQIDRFLVQHCWRYHFQGDEIPRCPEGPPFRERWDAERCNRCVWDNNITRSGDRSESRRIRNERREGKCRSFEDIEFATLDFDGDYATKRREREKS